MKNHTAGLLLIHGDSAEDFLSPHFLHPFTPLFFPQLMLKQSHWTQINRSLLIPFEKKNEKKECVCMCVVQEDQNEAKVKGKMNVKRETESLP